MRLDIYLTERGLAETRARAKRMIESGALLLDGVAVTKPAFDVEGDPTVTVREDRFVGRGGEKLAAALTLFSVDATGLRALDIGASTGGFTDCLLQNGAAEVVALDAGCGQLHPKLLADRRVINMEKYNARELDRKDVGEVSLVVMDVSFISQTYILPRIPSVLSQDGRAITLIKPQFEAGRAALNKKGIVKSPRDRILAIKRVLAAAAPSPVLGGDGNVEYLALFVRKTEENTMEISVEKTVNEGVIIR